MVQQENKMTIQNHLITLNSRGKVQIVNLALKQLMTYFEIHRITGQIGGKQTVQPLITISQGKAKRTPIQQAELEYNSHLKKYLDKGYKKLSDFTKLPFDEVPEEDLYSYLGDFKTDQDGIPKPMLAQQSDKCSLNIFEKDQYCSRKLDGVRCLMYFKDGEIRSASRGGKEYDVPTTLIRQDEKLIEWFKENPTLILDGEIYNHGESLQRISGIARLKEWEERCEVLQYWVYDIVSDKPFSERYEMLMDLQEIIEEEAMDRVVIIDHFLLAGWLVIKKRHDLFVSEGYEGLVMRNPKKEYGIGKRSSLYMVKLKDYQDDTFTVVGWAPGLRPIEDMVFICALHGREKDLEFNDKNSFKAKPMGNRAVKEEYVENMDNLIGQKADVKYFSFSEDGIPLQPTFKAFRYDI